MTLQNLASWLIVDANQIPGGLASTDVTSEGFVSSPCYPCPLHSLNTVLTLSLVAAV